MSIMRFFSLMAIASLLCGCSSLRSRALHDVENSPVTAEAMSAGEFLLSLREQGQLPGVSKDAHGEIRFDFAFPLPKEVAYPLSQTFQISLKDQSFANHYAVQRETKDSAWHLQRAWQTDSEGRTVKEWPIK